MTLFLLLLRRAVIISLLFIPDMVMADFTLDTSAQAAVSTGNPVTLAYTPGANARVLTLHLTTATTTTRTGGVPTLNGEPFIQVSSTQVGTAECTAELWYFINPKPSVAYTISVPNAGGLSLRVMAATFSSTRSSGAALDVFGQQGGGGANPSLSVTPNTNGSVIVDVLCDGNNNDPTGNSQTLIFESDEGSYSSNYQYALQSTSAAITFSYTVSSDDISHVVGAFQESHAGAVLTNTSLVQDSKID